ncbi:DUF202 domain-containing protein [Amycolatopsis alkalitolerans]|uniref:DUF202 domain-containing protein n=1 Tax=Amycolatopsis alkalitolerans TaxID=2547244 RepID=A0A5C4M3H1_9PSEU|nr:DUF202 domain-containing protein [Amycolatopsis alkalitolerans]TNC27613.1 DUF202 domain-containing protein [Amycolatopsis alkalitolerans]
MTSRDPGLQPERTTLSWQRTGLSAAIVTALLVRQGILTGSALEAAAGCCGAVLVVLTLVSGRRPGVHRWRLLLATSLTVATASLATVRLFWIE